MKTIRIQIIFFGLVLLIPHIHAADYPTANFSADVTSGPPPLTAQFTDLSTGEIDYWEWDFDGDGVADSIEQDPSYIYNDEGTYTVSLYVSGRWGENKITRDNYIDVVKAPLAPGSPGTVKWILDFGSDIRLSSPAISDDGTIYLGASDGHLYAINLDGEIEWSYQTGSENADTPSINSDTVYITSSDGSLYAVNFDGSLKWRNLFQENVSITQLSLLSIGPNGTIYLSSYSNENDVGLLTAINPDGTDRWTISSLSGSSTPVVDHNGNVYVLGSNLIKYNSEGSKLWELELVGNNYNPIKAPLALGKHIYVLTTKFYAVNYNGTIAWQKKEEPETTFSVVVGDNVLYAGKGTTGKVYTISPDTGIVNWEFSEGGGPAAGTPVIGSNGTVYVRFLGGIYAISPEGEEKWSCSIRGSAREIYLGYSSPVIYNKVLYVGTGIPPAPLSEGLPGRLYAIHVESESIADTLWPMLQRDRKHTGGPVASSSGSTFPVYRFWSDIFRGHFFTTSEAEKFQLICCDSNWNYEGISWYVYSDQKTDTLPIQRFWSYIFGHHFYTASLSERDQLVCCDPNWNYEGSAWYAFTEERSNTIKVYRFWSDVFRGHFFTTSETEKDHLICCDPNWTYEGIAYYALP